MQVFGMSSRNPHEGQGEITLGENYSGRKTNDSLQEITQDFRE